MALGVTLAVTRLGGSLNSILTPYLYEVTQGLFWPLTTGTIICIFSFFTGVACFYMDYQSDKREKLYKQYMMENYDVRQFKHDPEEKFKLSDIKKFTLIYYMLTLNCFFGFGAFFTFNDNINDQIVKQFGCKDSDVSCANPTIKPDTAGDYISIIYTLGAITSPFIGMLIDKYGKRASLVVVSQLFFIGCLILFMIMSYPMNAVYSLIPLTLLGLYFSLYGTAFWPCVPLTVDKIIYCTAFGIVDCAQNIGMTVFPYLFGFINDFTKNKPNTFHGYKYATMLILFLIVIAFLIAIIVNIIDFKTKRVLNDKYSGKIVKSQKSSLTESFHVR